jgi:hypothetical protein
MPAISYPPNDTPSTARTLYTTEPWTDTISGTQWLWEATPGRWTPYTAPGVELTAENLPAHTHDDRYYTEEEVDTLLSGKAPLASPTFTGTVTIPSGASISGYLTTATAASTYQPIGSYAPATGIAPSAITGTAVTLSGDQTITGVKTFDADGQAVFDGSSATFNSSGVYFNTSAANFNGTSAANFNIGSSANFDGSTVNFYTGSANFDGTSAANFATGSSITLADGVNWNYTSTAKTEHLTALGGTAIGRSLFTTTNASTAWTELGGAGTITTPNFTSIGATTPGTGAFTTLSASGVATFPNLIIRTAGALDVATAQCSSNGFIIGHGGGTSVALGNWNGQGNGTITLGVAGKIVSGSGGANSMSVDVTFSRKEAGIWRFGTTAANSLGSWEATNGTLLGTLAVTGASTLTGGYILGELSVGTLPTASTNARRRYEATFALAPSIGAVVAAGGSARCTVRSNGTNWIVTELL